MNKLITAITIDLTEQCNLRCVYCFTSGKTNNKLKKETGEDIIKWFLSEEVSGNKKDLSIAFWGGEPLLEFELMKYLVEFGDAEAKKCGKRFRYSMTTNMTLLSPEVCNWMKNNKIGALYSVDGTKDNHNRNRPLVNGLGSFHLIEEGIRNLKASQLPICLRFTLTPENVKDLYSDIKWYIDNYQIETFHFSPAYEHDWNDSAMEELERQFELLTKEIINQFDSGKQLRLRPLAYGITNIINAPFAKERNSCGAGCNYIGVSTEGALYPCHRFHDFYDERPWREQEKCLGNIYEGITNETWHDNFLNLQKNIVNNQTKCCECELYQQRLCFGGCMAANMDITGNILDHPKAACELEKLQVKYARILLEKYKDSRKFLSIYVERNNKCTCNEACHSDVTCGCYAGCYNDTLPSVTREIGKSRKEIEEIREKVKTAINMGYQIPADILEFLVDTI